MTADRWGAHRGSRRGPSVGARTLALGLGALVVVLGVLGPAPASAAGPATQAGVAAQADDPGDALPSDPPVAPDEARDEAEEILAGSEYQAPEQRERTILDRIRDWIADRLPDVDTGGRAGDGFDLVSVLIVGALLVGAVVAGVLLVARSRRSRRAPEDEDPDIEVELTALRSPDEWEAEARRATADGEHDLAVRAWFRALVGRLAARDLVLDTPGRTAGELVQDLEERSPGLVEPVEPLAHLFEDVWFGGRDAGPAEAARAEQLFSTTMAAAPRHPIEATEPTEPSTPSEGEGAS